MENDGLLMIPQLTLMTQLLSLNLIIYMVVEKV